MNTGPASVPIDARTAAAELEVALLSALGGFDVEAEERLVRLRGRGRQHPLELHIELALAEAAILRDADGNAEAHLRRAEALAPSGDGFGQAGVRLAWLHFALRTGGRTEAVRAESLPNASRLAAAGHLLASELAEGLGDREAARAAALSAASSADSSQLGRALGSWARYRLAELDLGSGSGRDDDPRREVEAVLAGLERGGLRRLRGRMMIRWAKALARTSGAAAGDAPAWLARAELTLGDAATFRDRADLRDGLTRGGRRARDKSLPPPVTQALTAYEELRARLDQLDDEPIEALDTWEEQSSAAAVLRQLRARARARRSLLTQLDGVVRRVVAMGGDGYAERDQLGAALPVLASLAEARDERTLLTLLVSETARLLGADTVSLFQERAEGWVTLASVGEPAAREAGELAPRSGTHLVARQDDPAGRAVPSCIEAPFLVSGRAGVLRADKHARGGRFGPREQSLAELLSEHAAGQLAKLDARAGELAALRRTQVALDAMRDGVLLVDADGTVACCNEQAARSLGVDGRIIGDLAASCRALDPLRALLAKPVDGCVLHLGRGTFIASSRELPSGGGMLLNLVELESAQRLARTLPATATRYTFADVVGVSDAIQETVARARQAAQVDASVLLTGESGTGKEVVAQAIHAAGARAREPFVGVNCAALPRELLEAELFGYEKGAFTGARHDGSAGKFELAGRGTILLDEIGDMPLDMQAKLLRVLQERVVTRLGGAREIAIHARVIATTHRDLEALVEEGRFRLDLLYRLRVLTVRLPALRERRSDIPMLALHHLRRFAGQQRKSLVDIARALRERLAQYPWPGNVRELTNLMEAEVSLAPADTRVLSDLATGGPGGRRIPAAPARDPDETGPVAPLVEVERRAYLGALRHFQGNVQRAAEALGVSRVTFYGKLKQWGVRPDSERPRPLRSGQDESPPSSRRRGDTGT